MPRQARQLRASLTQCRCGKPSSEVESDPALKLPQLRSPYTLSGSTPRATTYCNMPREPNTPYVAGAIYCKHRPQSRSRHFNNALLESSTPSICDSFKHTVPASSLHASTSRFFSRDSPSPPTSPQVPMSTGAIRRGTKPRCGNMLGQALGANSTSDGAAAALAAASVEEGAEGEAATALAALPTPRVVTDLQARAEVEPFAVSGLAAEFPWRPPRSPFGLLEELFWDRPWALLLSCILLNQTTRIKAMSRHRTLRPFCSSLALAPLPANMIIYCSLTDSSCHSALHPGHSVGG